MSVREINPEETTRASAYKLWMKAPNPMVTFFKTFDVMPLINKSRTTGMKFNMLLDHCIGKAASSIKEFYFLPVGDKLMQYDKIAVNTIVKNKEGEVSSCDIAYTDDLEQFNADYLQYTKQVHDTCSDHDLSENYMVIGTSAIVDTEIDGDKALLPVSFQFHHTQMDGAHAGAFLRNLEEEIGKLRSS